MGNTVKWSSIALVLVVVCHTMDAYNILIMSSFGSRSHQNIFDAIAEKLVERQHRVTLVTSVKDTQPIQNVTHVYVEVDHIFEKYNFSLFQGATNDLSILKALIDMMFEVRDATFNQSDVRVLLKSPEAMTGPKYHVLIVNAVFNEFSLPLAHHLGIPAIYISPSILFSPITWNLDIPYPYSYLSTGLSTSHQRLNFAHRSQSTFTNLVLRLVRNWYIFPNHDSFFAGVLPGTPPLVQLEKNVSFVMTHTHPSLYPSAPSMPYTVEIGCVHCRPAQPLPEDLSKFFESSGEHGVIYFSLGSSSKFEKMPLEILKRLIKAFSKVPQKVLWKYESVIEGLPANVKMISWTPQQDVLGHPNLRLFITHGGWLSVLEAAYHACPIIGLPFVGDQLGNVANARIVGFGETIHWKDLSSDKLLKTIQKVLEDPRYKEKAIGISDRLKDQPQPPAEKAAYWIEFVVRHRGAPHLKSAAGKLNFFQYFLLDVMAFVVVVTFIVCIIVCSLIKTVLCRISSGTKKRKKN